MTINFNAQPFYGQILSKVKLNNSQIICIIHLLFEFKVKSPDQIITKNDNFGMLSRSQYCIDYTSKRLYKNRKKIDASVQVYRSLFSR
jgi:hypothetical protein